jgi:hypothetical protein
MGSLSKRQDLSVLVKEVPCEPEREFVQWALQSRLSLERTLDPAAPRGSGAKY